MEISKIGEVDLIARIQRRFSGGKDDQLKIGIGDDAAAVLSEPGKLLLLTTDMLVEGNHFLRGSISYKDLGYKSLAVNLSDIAAMGGYPGYAVVSLALPPDLKLQEFDSFYDGIQEVALNYGVAVIGGDITSSKLGMVINITVAGYAGKEKIIRQNGAEPGDLIAVTGALGASQAGLLTLLYPEIDFPTEAREKALNKHYRPVPRLKEGLILANTEKIHAMKDISDGLAKEINTIAHSSGVMAVVDAARIPISPGAVEIGQILKKNPLEMAVQGGEEYELLFTFAARDYEALYDIAYKNNMSISLIGRVEEGEGVFIEIDGQNEPLFFKGYQHF
jgi:thiamine-monophosphate kinase